VKVYLDQKDFSRIARGLIGEKEYKTDSEVYDFLKERVASGDLTIYFSWCHVVEAVKYHDLRGDLWRVYCNVVDTLTDGNCIVGPATLVKREVELFLAKKFNFRTALSKESYGYGKYVEALSTKPTTCFSLKEEVKKKLFENLAHFSLKDGTPLFSGREKAHLIKKCLKTKNIKKIFESMSGSKLSLLCDQAVSSFPGPDEFKSDFLQSVDKRELMISLFGTPMLRLEVMNNFLDHISKFSKLIPIYSSFMPELQNIVEKLKLNSIGLLLGFKKLQLANTILKKDILTESQFRSNLVRHFTEQIMPQVKSLSVRHRFSHIEAKTELLESDLKQIPILYWLTISATQYFIKHKGNLQRGRTPRESDVLDLFHLLNLPYVDVYLTDAFFTEVAKPGQELFNTTIFRNLVKLRDYLIENDVRNTTS
jgi:hypothetical protein